MVLGSHFWPKPQKGVTFDHFLPFSPPFMKKREKEEKKAWTKEKKKRKTEKIEERKKNMVINTKITLN